MPMENFVVSARKYRPNTFDTVVGQSSIANTLKNAIKTDHLAQAFLFCGPRGVGKTTCARILAKTINCQDRSEKIEACDQCDSCNSFNEGASLNVYELDAASNNSVDNIRELIDQVRIAPQLGSHKVYIIDEVHMLSSSAFNAFLKTLEEPPPHAIFILATTEKHKIIPTILSRCQIFDFNRIRIEDMANHLANIAKSEKVEAEQEALHLIAEKADGALRDALSIFDQLVNFTNGNLRFEAVLENLNILDYDYFFKATEMMAKQDIPSLLNLLDEVIKKGFDGHQFINGLSTHLRNLLVGQNPSTIALLEVGPQVQKKYLEQAKLLSSQHLLEALEICRQCDVQYKASNNQRLLAELSLMQLASIGSPAQQDEKKKPKIIAPPSDLAKRSDQMPIKENTTIELKDKALPTAAKVSKIQETSIEEEKPIIDPPPSLKETVSKPKSNPGIDKTSKSKTSALSIKNLTQSDGDEKDAEEEEFQSDLREAIDPEQFKKAWAELAEDIKNSETEGRSIVYAALITHEAKLAENFTIELPLDNLSQAEEIKMHQSEIHSFLRKKLKNGALNLKVSIIKDPKEKKAYTPEEKFNKLAEENPSLKRLKKELDLDFF